MDQVLSQSEVDALLNAVSDGRIDSQDGGSGGDATGVVHYDLANQDRIIRGRMPTLDIIHDRFIRLFRVSLSAALRKVANIGVNSSGPIKFGEFMNSLPLPSCLNILRVRYNENMGRTYHRTRPLFEPFYVRSPDSGRCVIWKNKRESTGFSVPFPKKMDA